MPKQPKVLFGHTSQAQHLPSAPAVRTLASTHTASTSNTPAPKVPFGQAHTPSINSHTPKVLAGGIARQRIPCTIEQLRQLQTNANMATLLNAQQLVNSINLDDAHFDDVLQLGTDLQIEHGRITEAELAIANRPTLAQARTCLTAILGHLKALDPEQVFLDEKTGILNTLTRLVLLKPSAQLIFDKHYPQLQTLIAQLQQHIAALKNDCLTLSALLPRYDALAQNLESTLIAAQFMLQHLQQQPLDSPLQRHYQSQADALATRTNSLLSTQTTLGVSRLTHASLLSNLEAMLNTCRSLIEEDLPAFYSAYTTALTLAQAKHSVQASTLDPIRQMHHKMTEKLQGETHG